MIQTNAENATSPCILIRPSKEIHPHYKALEKFHEQLADTKVEILYEMLDTLSVADLTLVF